VTVAILVVTVGPSNRVDRSLNPPRPGLPSSTATHVITQHHAGSSHAIPVRTPDCLCR